MLLIDNNLSPKLAAVLQKQFNGIIHVADVSLDEEDDIKIWDYAKSEQLHILTKDSDYNDIQHLRGFPPKIIWVRSGNVSTRHIITLLQKKSDEIIEFLKDDNLGILEVL